MNSTIAIPIQELSDLVSPRMIESTSVRTCAVVSWSEVPNLTENLKDTIKTVTSAGVGIAAEFAKLASAELTTHPIRIDQTLLAPTLSWKLEALELESYVHSQLDEWKAATEFLSSRTQASMHPAYQRIIGLGHSAVPFLLKRLRDHRIDVFWALKAITRANPSPLENRGSFEGMRHDWLQWGREHGLI